jgi:hypothetical protein
MARRRSPSVKMPVMRAGGVEHHDHAHAAARHGRQRRRHRRVFGQRRDIDLHDVGDVGQQLAAQRATGVGAGEIVGAETARVEQGDRQCVAEGQGRGSAGGGARFSGQASWSTRASRWMSASWASEEVSLPVMAISLPPRRFHQRHDGQQLVVLAGIGNGDQHVVAGDHAQVAMHGLGGMDEIGRGAGAGEGGGQLARDVAGLADAADDDAAAAFQDQRDRGAELRPDAPRQRRDGGRLDLKHLAAHGHDAGIVGDVGSVGRNGLVHRWPAFMMEPNYSNRAPHPVP